MAQASPRAAAAAHAVSALSPRQRQVLHLLLEGTAGEKGIAAELGLSVNTVHVYVKALYRQFDVHSRPELMARCLRVGGSTPV